MLKPSRFELRDSTAFDCDMKALKYMSDKQERKLDDCQRKSCIGAKVILSFLMVYIAYMGVASL